jgi:hypothetical protein
MSYLSKEAFLKVKKAECFDIVLPDEKGTLRARAMDTLEHAKFYEADKKAQNPVLRMVMLALLCLVDPEDPMKRMFDAESSADQEAVGRLDIDCLVAIREQYTERVDAPKNENEMKDLAKKSEATDSDVNCLVSVAS